MDGQHVGVVAPMQVELGHHATLDLTGRRHHQFDQHAWIIAILVVAVLRRMFEFGCLAEVFDLFPVTAHQQHVAFGQLLRTRRPLLFFATQQLQRIDAVLLAHADIGDGLAAHT